MAYKVCIDPGHGGSDSGAVTGKHVEKTYNLDTALSCRDELQRYGVKVVMTRTADKFLSLERRCEIANQNGCDYFVSIHHNSGGGDRGEVIYSKAEGNGLQMAHKIAKEMKVDMGQTEVKEYKRLNKSGKTDYYAVIRRTNMPANIVEICFLDNKKDVEIADTLAERKRNGKEIAQGILKHLGIKVDEKGGEDMVDKIVLYHGDADVFAAIVVAQKYKCPVMKETDFKVSGLKAKEVVQIGGKAEDANRFQTFKNAAKLL